MQDTLGFPVDASFEEARQRGYKVDWLEALSACWINDCAKFNSFVRQAESCTQNTALEQLWKESNMLVLNRFPKMLTRESPITVSCKYILGLKGKFKHRNL